MNLKSLLIVTEKFNQAYKSIGEVAKLLKLVNKKNGSLNTHTIRYWEKEFKNIKPKILTGKRRYYNNIEIQKLKKIQYLLKNKGLTIKGVKMYLLNNSLELDETSNNSINVSNKDILKKKITKISKLIKNIKK
tara:strand:- start:705 stop:1103 length:399 start_codon:yes stop_codon:yes gene_type:complete